MGRRRTVSPRSHATAWAMVVAVLVAERVTGRPVVGLTAAVLATVDRTCTIAVAAAAATAKACTVIVAEATVVGRMEDGLDAMTLAEREAERAAGEARVVARAGRAAGEASR